MSFKFDGKVVVITGSSSGIGQAAAVLFAKAGAFVTIHGRSEEGLAKTRDLIAKAGVSNERIHSVKGAVTEDSVLKALIDETIQKFGRLDVLVNNVGVSNKEGEKNHRSMANLDHILSVNVKSIIALTELAIPHLEKTKGNIINVSSIAAQKTSPAMPFYMISKAALDHFARNYAAILAPLGIRINNLNPGATHTAFMSRHGVTDEMMAKIMKDIKIPLNRFATAEEMAEYLLFMASDKEITSVACRADVPAAGITFPPTAPTETPTATPATLAPGTVGCSSCSRMLVTSVPDGYRSGFVTIDSLNTADGCFAVQLTCAAPSGTDTVTLIGNDGVLLSRPSLINISLTCNEQAQWKSDTYGILSSLSCGVAIAPTTTTTLIPPASTVTSGKPDCSAAVWAEWESWSDCTDICGACGLHQRFRACTKPDPSCLCVGTAFQKEACNFDVCKYPRNSSCCTNYEPKSSGGLFQCVPIASMRT